MRPYVARLDAQAVTAAITLIQVKAPATGSLVLLRAWASQSSSAAAAQLPVELVRASTDITGSAFTPLALNENDPAASSTVLVNATAEGTKGNVLIREAWDYLNGWLWLPTPDERITVAAGSRICLYLPVAPSASVTLTAGIVFGEV